MTRFNITLEQATEMVFWVLENSYGGEIFVPKIPSYQITDLAEAIGPSCKKTIIGVRSGEKIHEEMITAADSYNTFDLGEYYAIIHPTNEIKKNQYQEHFQSLYLKFDQMEIGSSYNSKENKPYLTVKQIRDLIKTNLSEKFKPI
jgi:FlaA1/EpsC-like NDP-sugar epimerase